MADGHKWRILICSNGIRSNYLSMFLDFADAETQPSGWHIFAQFRLTLVNQRTSSLSVRRESQHLFSKPYRNWGFSSFMRMSDLLFELEKGYIIDDTLVVEAEVVISKISQSRGYESYDYKKETGCVGLKNQGATCYMNSLVQTLYHIPYFRKAVYHMPTTESDDPAKNIPLALQSLFYRLQYSDTSVSTTELTKSFGWNIHDGYQQHDVQEFNMVLCETLENKMKGTDVEGTIPELFEGHLVNYVQCIHVECKSFKKESYYDLQLDVKGCPNIYASFDKYCEGERLEGDNKYRSEEFGLQDAKKGCLFSDFPPVLFLHLKRFEYDSQKGEIFKIFDHYEFPLELDLDKDNRKYLSPDSDKSVRNLFTLYSVIVHSGNGVHEGHYYTFIRPGLSNQWLKFNDEQVSKEDVKTAVEGQYGGEEEVVPANPGFTDTLFKITKHSNAYMLVYVRESNKDKIICSVEEKDIAGHLRKKLKRDQGEDELKDKKKVNTGQSLFDKSTPFRTFKDQHPIPLKDKSDDDMLLFFKLYDPQKVEIRHMGRFYVRASGTPFEILSKLNQMAEFSPDEAILLYKEEKSTPYRWCKYIDMDITFQSSELHDGDIIYYQKAPIEDSKETILYPDFPSFLEYDNFQQVVHFRLLKKLTEDILCLELPKLLKDDDIVARVAQQINADDPSRICLTSHDYLLQQPMLQPIECLGVKHLSDALWESQHLSDILTFSQLMDILYYDVLDPSLPELQCSKTLSVTFRHASGNETTVHMLTLPGNSTVGEFLNYLGMKVDLSAPDAKLRLLQVKSHKIYKV